MNPAYQAALDRLEKKADKVVMGQAMKFHGMVTDNLSQPGRGRVYGKHQASAPGDPPAVDTGLLRQSVQFARLAPLTWGVGLVALPYPGGSASTAEVGKMLEDGNRKVAPRPFVRSALQVFKARRLS